MSAPLGVAGSGSGMPDQGEAPMPHPADPAASRPFSGKGEVAAADFTPQGIPALPSRRPATSKRPLSSEDEAPAVSEGATAAAPETSRGPRDAGAGASRGATSARKRSPADAMAPSLAGAVESAPTAALAGMASF